MFMRKKVPPIFFANVKEVLAADDLTIANLETCLTNEHQKE